MKMTFERVLGSDVDADVMFRCSDGVLLPAHRLVLRLESTRLIEYIDKEEKATYVQVPFTGQAMWRVLSFVYTSSYNDEEKDLSVFKTDPCPSTASTALTIGAMEDVTTGFSQLSLSADVTRFPRFSRAWIHVETHVLACSFGLDRLAIDSCHRFAEEINGRDNSAALDKLQIAEQECKKKNDQISFLQSQVKELQSQAAQNKPKVESFGLLEKQIKAINGSTTSSPATSHVQDEDYFQRSERLKNAGINGHQQTAPATNGHTSNQAPTSMQLTTRVGSQAVNGSLPASPNGPHRGQNGNVNLQAVNEKQAKEIKELQKNLKFTRDQLSQARLGPVTRSQPGPRSQSGPASPLTERRYKNLLTALKEAALDHKHCTDPECHINFNCQYLDVVGDKNQRTLILKCTACEAETHRWNLD